MKNDNENKIDQEDEGRQDGESGGTGQGGGTGSGVHFRYKDSLSVGPRDDALPPSEIKRLLAMHDKLHKEYVNKQKLTRKERKALKEGRKLIAGGPGSRRGHGAGRVSIYKQHPISKKAQFSGMDRQVIALPNENSKNTNDDRRNELENRLEHRLENRNELRHQHVPKFNPTPRPR